MAKKKQTTKPAVNDISQVNIGYKGEVTVKLLHGKKVVTQQHIVNTGTRYFFRGLAAATINTPYTDLTSSTPNYLGVGTGISETSDLDKVKLVRELPTARAWLGQYKRIESTETGYKAIFIGVISNTSGDVNELGLFGTETGDSLLARVQLKDPIQLQPTFSLVVEWNLSFENIQKENINGSN